MGKDGIGSGALLKSSCVFEPFVLTCLSTTPAPSPHPDHFVEKDVFGLRRESPIPNTGKPPSALSPLSRYQLKDQLTQLVVTA